MLLCCCCILPGAAGMDVRDASYANFQNPNSWYSLLGAVVCVCCAALAAGLTVGLLSLDPLEMEVKKRVGTPEEKRHAAKICPLIHRHHLLLVTLLLFNSLANEALPIFLAELVPGYVAVALSVTMILVFGEIIPSAVFTGPRQVAIASRMSWVVVALMTFFCPIAKPIAWLLDNCLGRHGLKRYTREELSALVELQRDVHRRRAGGGAHPLLDKAHNARPITMDEATIVAGVLKCHSKTVKDAMTRMDEVYVLSMDDVLDEDKMVEIMACGFSRIPVHSTAARSDIRGFLLVKRLIVLDPEDSRPVRTLPLRQPIVVSPHDSLLELINVFQEGRSHMALVSPVPELTRHALRDGIPLQGPAAPIGIVTLEDLFEEILQEEIYDEADQIYRDKEKKAIETLKRIRRNARKALERNRQGTTAAGKPHPQINVRTHLLSVPGDGHTHRYATVQGSDDRV